MTASSDQVEQKVGSESISGLLYQLAMQSPGWVRVVVVLVLTIAVALAVKGRVSELVGTAPSTSADGPKPSPPVPAPISIQIQNGPYPLDQGKQISPIGSANRAPQNEDSTQHLGEDANHAAFHLNHPEDDPKLVMIAKLDDKNDLSYKFYSKTDKCVWVMRHQNGVPISQWVKDPAFENGVAKPPLSSEVRTGPRPEPASRGLFDGLVPYADAQEIQFRGNTPLQPVQAGCVNPHPGQYSWWWGPPQDQCWSPMYRQWRDGCTHYQMYNRCANAWDGRINWVKCNANHSQ